MLIVKRIFLFILSFFVFLIIFGFAIEFYYWQLEKKGSNWHDPNTTFDPIIGWVPIRNIYIDNWGGITTNTNGFRSSEVIRSKKTIALLGDSVVWGYGISDSETVSHHLEKRVNGSGYQVQNLGVSGYDIGQYYLYLQRNINKLDSLDNLILFITSGNDLRDSATNSLWGKRKPLYIINNSKLVLTEVPIYKYCFRNVISKSYLINRLSKKNKMFKKKINNLAGDITIDFDQSKQAINLLVDMIYSIAEEKESSFHIMLVPLKDDFDKRTESLVWFEQYLKSSKYNYINVFDIIKRSKLDVDRLYIDDPFHFSDEGNDVLAQIIYKEIITK